MILLHLTYLYKIKNPYMLGKKGFRGTILYRIKFIPSYYLKTTTESRSEDMTLRGMLYLKIKDLRLSQALSLQNQLHAQKVRFCALPADCWGPCLQNHGPSKIYIVQICPKLMIFGCLPAHGLWFCSKVGVQEGSPESKIFGVPAPSIL